MEGQGGGGKEKELSAILLATALNSCGNLEALRILDGPEEPEGRRNNVMGAALLMATLLVLLSLVLFGFIL